MDPRTLLIDAIKAKLAAAGPGHVGIAAIHDADGDGHYVVGTEGDALLYGDGHDIRNADALKRVTRNICKLSLDHIGLPHLATIYEAVVESPKGRLGLGVFGLHADYANHLPDDLRPRSIQEMEALESLSRSRPPASMVTSAPAEQRRRRSAP